MKILICIKQVPNTNEVKIDQKSGTLIREGVPSIINPDDKNAIEAAVTLKEKYGGEVIVLTMGPPQADFALREALAMGADRAVLLSDRAFAGADTWATSLTLAQAIKKFGSFDIIFCGRQAIDGDTAQVGPELAHHLNIPQVTYVRRIVSIENKRIIVERALEDGYELIEAELPILLTAVKELNIPRYPTAFGIVDAFAKKQVLIWSASDITSEPDKLGIKGSPTKVKRTFTPSPKGIGIMLNGSPRDMVQGLIKQLQEIHVI